MEKRLFVHIVVCMLGSHPILTMFWASPEVPGLTKTQISPLPNTGAGRAVSSGRQWEKQEVSAAGFGVDMI